MTASGPSDRHLRIRHVIAGFDPALGGPSTVLTQLAAAQSRAGHEVDIVTTDVGFGGRFLELAERAVTSPDGYTVRYHRCQRPKPPYPSMGLLRDVWSNALRADVTHVHGLFNMPVSASQAVLQRRRAPYVVRACGMLDRYSLTQRSRLKTLWMRLIERNNLEGAARIQVSTPMELNDVLALGLRTPLEILPQGVSPIPRSQADSPHPRPYIVFLSRVAKKKGLPMLVRAFAQLAQARPMLDLVIAGPDERDHRAEVAAVVADCALSRRVHFVGKVLGDEKARWLTHAELFALPSMGQNFGVVVIEAASVGLPLVISDQVGLADAVRSHGAGHVVPRNVAALAEALLVALDAGRQAYAAGTTSLTEAYSWSTAAPRIEAMYREVLSERQRPSA